MFLPKSIDLNRSEQYILSIRISHNGFMFSISDPANGSNYCLRETSFVASDNLLTNVQRIVFELGFLTQQFLHTHVVFVSREYDIVPMTYFEVKEASTLYDTVHTHKGKHLLHTLHEKLDCMTIYNVDKQLVEFLSRSLFNPQFHAHSALLVNGLKAKMNVSCTTSKMYLNFHSNDVDIVCFRQAELIHCLSYEDESPTNQIYYTLKLWESCAFNQITDHLYIIGQADEQIVAGLHHYIKNIECMNAPSEVHLWNEEAQVAPFDLLTLSL